MLHYNKGETVIIVWSGCSNYNRIVITETIVFVVESSSCRINNLWFLCT